MARLRAQSLRLSRNVNTRFLVDLGSWRLNTPSQHSMMTFNRKLGSVVEYSRSGLRPVDTK